MKDMLCPLKPISLDEACLQLNLSYDRFLSRNYSLHLLHLTFPVALKSRASVTAFRKVESSPRPGLEPNALPREFISLEGYEDPFP